MTKYSELKTKLMKCNLDADLPNKYLHIDWATFHKIVKKYLEA